MAITSDAYEAARNLVQADAENEADGLGLIRWMPHTQTDPGCYDKYVDFEIKNWRYDTEESVWTGDVKAWVRGTVVFDREYLFYYSGAYMHREYEDV